VGSDWAGVSQTGLDNPPDPDPFNDDDWLWEHPDAV
jgi:hypothetical protein